MKTGFILDWHNNGNSPELHEEIRELGENYDLGQNNFFKFNRLNYEDKDGNPYQDEEGLGERFRLICKACRDAGTDECIILYWW